MATKSIPLNFDYKKDEFFPNLETQQAIIAARQEYQSGKLPRYSSADDAMTAMAELANE